MRAAMAIGIALGLLTAGAATAQTPPAVVAVPADLRELAEETSFNGRLDADQRVAIVARVGGTLEEVGFRFGETVEAGRVLFRIDPRPFAALVQEARGALRTAEAARC